MTISGNVLQRPVAEKSRVSKPFWEGTQKEELVLQKCQDCKEFVFYPRILCPFCSSSNLGWEKVSGKGNVYSFSTVLNNAPTAFQTEVPFTIAVVRLAEGVQMLSNIVECDPSEIKCDMPVEVVFQKINAVDVYPMFRPVKGK